MTQSRRPLFRAAASLAAVSALALCLAPGCRQSGPSPTAEERSAAPVRREAAPVRREAAPVRREAAPTRQREDLSRLNQGPRSETVYITESGKKYHRLGCKYLKSSRQAISRSKARASGHSACSVCDP